MNEGSRLMRGHGRSAQKAARGWVRLPSAARHTDKLVGGEEFTKARRRTAGQSGAS